MTSTPFVCSYIPVSLPHAYTPVCVLSFDITSSAFIFPISDIGSLFFFMPALNAKAPIMINANIIFIKIEKNFRIVYLPVVVCGNLYKIFVFYLSVFLFFISL